MVLFFLNQIFFMDEKDDGNKSKNNSGIDDLKISSWFNSKR